MIKLVNNQGDEIRSLDGWSRPKKTYQWRPGRSAMELGRCWLREGFPACPPELRELLDSSPLTQGLELHNGKPEFVTKLPERGEGRNHDLWVRGSASGAPITLCIEAKTDESFGPIVGEYVRDAKENNAGTGVPRRVAALLEVLNVRCANLVEPPYCDLRYQLLAGVAGTCIQAIADRSEVGVFIVHEFRGDGLDDRKLRLNESDLQFFMRHVIGRSEPILPGRLYGPLAIGGVFCYVEIIFLIVFLMNCIYRCS
jgi:hypothetical protein